MTSNPHSFQIIPAIDLLDGEVVRLKKGRYDDVTAYSSNPVNIAHQFSSAGATRIHIVDLDGAKSGQTANATVIQDIRNTVDCEIELGGGIRTLDQAQKWIDIGVNYVILGSLLVQDWPAAEAVIRHFPNQIIAGVDVNGTDIATDGWTQQSGINLFEFCQKLNDTPLDSIICTDIERDGMLTGPNVELLTTLAQTTSAPIIASGGIRDIADIETLQGLSKNNIGGCVIGKAIFEGKIQLNDLWPR